MRHKKREDTIRLRAKDFIPIYGCFHTYPSRNTSLQLLSAYTLRETALYVYNTAVIAGAVAGTFGLENVLNG